MFNNPLVLSRLLFFAFFGLFSFFLASIVIHDIQIHYHFLTFFGVLARGPLSAKFPPLAQTSSYATNDGQSA